jgi:hypothetical protein
MLEKYLYFIFIHLALLIPGYAIVMRFKSFKDRSPAIILGTAYATSLALFGTIALLTYAFKLPHTGIRIFAWSLLLVSTYVIIQSKLYAAWRDYAFPLASLFVLSLFSLVVIGLKFNAPMTIVPDPERLPNRNYEALTVKVLNVAQTPANDNYIPYRQAQFIVNRSDPAKDSFIDEWGVHFFQRTPLMGAITAYFFIMSSDQPPIDYTWSASAQDLDETFDKFQIISHILNGLFVIPAYYLLSKFFNRKTAAISTLFFTISPFFIYNAFFSWPKTLTTFFILVSWLLLYEKKTRYVVVAAILAGYAYLTHDLAVLYIGATCLALLWARRFKDVIIYATVPFLFIVPWLAVARFGFHKTSTFIYYPFSIHGIPQYEQRHEVVREFFRTSPLRLIAIKLDFLYYLFSPYQLIMSEPGQTLKRQLWAVGLFSVSGALGLGLLIPLVLAGWRAIFNKLLPLQYWIYAIVPVVLCTVIIGWPKGLGAMHFAQAVVVLFTGLAIHYLLHLKQRIWLLLAFAVNAVYLGYFIAFSFGFSVRDWLRSPSDLVSLVILAVVTIAYGYGVFWIANAKPATVRKFLT